MVPIIISILFTTGVCAFLFFILPWIDHQSQKRHPEFDEHQD